MPTPFSRSLRSLHADVSRRYLWMLLVAALVLAVWCAWFVLARVPVYVTSRVARIEVSQTAHPVQVQVPGQVIASHVALGQRVQAGEVLLELDTTSLRHALDEAQARRDGLGRQVAALREELAAREHTQEARRGAARAELREAQAAQEQAAAARTLAADKAARTDVLLGGGSVSELESVEANAAARQRRGDEQAARLRAERMVAEQGVREAEFREKWDELARELVRLEAELAGAGTQVEALTLDIERRTTRAPVAGRLDEVTPRPVGSHVEAGVTIATVIPEGELHLVGEFVPADVVGRVRPGQPARFRLEGFSWLEYGTVAATVSEVGSEARAGLTRIELRVPARGDGTERVPLEHGLPGTVEVEIERVSPATLVLRATGRMLAAADEAE